jgi:hypothetical protein
MNFSWGKRMYTEWSSRKERSGTVWLVAGVWQLTRVRRNTDKARCPLCLGEEDVKHILLDCGQLDSLINSYNYIHSHRRNLASAKWGNTPPTFFLLKNKYFFDNGVEKGQITNEGNIFKIIVWVVYSRKEMKQTHFPPLF